MSCDQKFICADIAAQNTWNKVKKLHCVKSVRTWSYSGPNFHAFGLNTERYQC